MVALCVYVCLSTGVAAELDSHLSSQHAAQLLEDQLARWPPAVAGNSSNNTLLGGVATVPSPSRGSRRARQPRRADSAPRTEAVPEASVWDEKDESKLQVTWRTQTHAHAHAHRCVCEAIITVADALTRASSLCCLLAPR